MKRNARVHILTCQRRPRFAPAAYARGPASRNRYIRLVRFILPLRDFWRNCRPCGHAVSRHTNRRTGEVRGHGRPYSRFFRGHSSHSHRAGLPRRWSSGTRKGGGTCPVSVLIATPGGSAQRSQIEPMWMRISIKKSVWREYFLDRLRKTTAFPSSMSPLFTLDRQ